MTEVGVAALNRTRLWLYETRDRIVEGSSAEDAEESVDVEED